MKDELMALKIGEHDAFERQYMGKFYAFAARFGEFVKYERDRAARDIGLHFVEPKESGGEIVSPALVWFQMKGIEAGTLSLEAFEKAGEASVKLDVPHLRFWYIAPDPTFLAVYVESADQFLVLNIKKFVEEQFGDSILTLKQKTMTVSVPASSVLDAQAFYLIKKSQSVEAWKARIKNGDLHAPIFFRDAGLIWRMGAIEEAGGAVSMTVRQYGTKTRSEVYFSEVDPEGGEGRLLRMHWESFMADRLETTFPYLDFDTSEGEDEEDVWDYDDDYSDHLPIELPNGKFVQPDGVFEMVDYVLSVTLNDVGRSWLETLRVMHGAGFVEISTDEADMVSVAPWHARSV